MMRLNGILRSNTILYCRHWVETVEFYRAVLGLVEAFANDWFVEFCLTERSFLSIADAARTSIEDVAGQGVTLAWQVDDLADAHGHLQALGIATTPVMRRLNAFVFYCHDPEGHRLEFWAEDPPE
jgi:catechol 2,3-dioxygenase-like lactoylglutathione lyase family enzyme